MKNRLGRRGALVALAGGFVPALACAQEAPALQPGNAPLPRTVTPASPPAAPRPSMPIPVSAIDRTKAYYVFFDQQIDATTMRGLRRQLANLVEAGVQDITLVINSGGGQVEPVMITYSFIRALPARISTHAQGFVMSAAMLLYLAGAERSADLNARFLCHPFTQTQSGVTAEPQLRERLMVLDAAISTWARIFRERTRLTDADIQRASRETVIWDAQQAAAAGIVTRLADLSIPGEGKARILLLD